MSTRFEALIGRLEQQYGIPEAPPPVDPLEWILWECVGYLCSDSKREEAFKALKERVGTEPEQILAASQSELNAICKMGGIMAELRAARMKEIARLALECDLDGAMKLPLKQAIREITRFPGFSTPGAEKILLFCGSRKLMPLDSNGLRVLLRIGYGRESANYSQSYRSVQRALEAELPDEPAWLMQAYLLIRQHGLETCRRTMPACPECPLNDDCTFALGGLQ